MNCKFCNSELIISELSFLALLIGDDVEEYYCDFCPVSVGYFIRNNEIISSIIYSNNRWYLPCFQLNLDYLSTKSALIYTDYNAKDHIIFSINSIPNITPSNFNEKLKLYLPLI